MASARSGVSTMNALSARAFSIARDMRLGEFDGGKLLLRKAVARAGEGEVREAGHGCAHSTTLGTTKK